MNTVYVIGGLVIAIIVMLIIHPIKIKIDERKEKNVNDN